MDNELFEKTPVPRAYMKLAIPIMMSFVLMLVYNMVDMYFIAKTGDKNLVAGVSLCAPVFTFLIAVGDVFGLGGCRAKAGTDGNGVMGIDQEVCAYFRNGWKERKEKLLSSLKAEL